MKRSMLFLTAYLFLCVGIHAWTQPDDQKGVVSEIAGPAVEAPEIEIIVLEDGTEEVQEIFPDSAYAPVMVDERFLAIRVDAQQKIDALLIQINGLADGSKEGQLQKQIEQIKMDAEIKRLALLKEDAENRKDDDLAEELANEIDHLRRIDEPVIGYQEEPQPQ
jgi:hypothetical protein